MFSKTTSTEFMVPRDQSIVNQNPKSEARKSETNEQSNKSQLKKSETLNPNEVRFNFWFF
jgi:hypothetical protein